MEAGAQCRRSRAILWAWALKSNANTSLPVMAGAPPRTRSSRWRRAIINDTAALDSGAQKASVRVRIQGEQAFLNLKSREIGHTRQEFDYPIPVRGCARAAGAVRRRPDRQATAPGATMPAWSGRWTNSSATTPGWWWPKSSWSTPTRPSTCPTGPAPKSPTRSRYYNLALAAHPYLALVGSLNAGQSRQTHLVIPHAPLFWRSSPQSGQDENRYLVRRGVPLVLDRQASFPAGRGPAGR